MSGRFGTSCTLPNLPDLSSYRSMQKARPLSSFELRLHAISGILFAIFLFCYFYFAVSPCLSLGQHQLSGGLTTYDPLIGAIILTGLLVGLHRICERFFPCRGRLYAASYFPSSAIAIILTAFTPHLRILPLIVAALLIIIWIIVASNCTRQFHRPPIAGDDRLRPHLIGFLFIAITMGAFGNTNDVLSYEIRTARLAAEGSFDQALKIGSRSLATSHRLVALRSYAMSRTPGGLGEHIFEQPMPDSLCDAEILYLAPADSSTTLLPPDSLYRHLGLLPGKASPRGYFSACAKRRPTSAARDYYLCGLLLDKQLDKFCDELPHYYIVSDSTVLPKYYAQALVLYNRLNPQKGKVYNNPNIVANYIDFKEKGAQQHVPLARRNLLRREYGDTYWWYYYYH